MEGTSGRTVCVGALRLSPNAPYEALPSLAKRGWGRFEGEKVNTVRYALRQAQD